MFTTTPPILPPTFSIAFFTFFKCLNVNNGITAENLKEVASLNATMKSMKDSGAPRKLNTVDVEVEEKKSE